MLEAALDMERIASHLRRMTDLAAGLDGHLTPREARFLALVAATLPPELGEILEIGSYTGKSTVLLAKSARFAGGWGVVACDPLSGECSTDPWNHDSNDLPELFRATVRENGVEDGVEFHRTTSGELARTWDRPLRFLWIDGDHTYAGTLADVDDYTPHLAPGAFVALHDALNRQEGPIRAVCERLLLSDRFGECGFCGSIAWARYLGEGATLPDALIRHKLRMYRRVSRLVPFCSLGRSPRDFGRYAYRLLRSRVPHGEIRIEDWLKLVPEPAESKSQPLRRAA